MHNRTEATEVGNFRKIMKSLGGENHLEGRNHYVGRNLWGEINGEKPFEWRETFRLERNLSIGEKPFDSSQLKFLCYRHYEEC